MTKLSGVHHQSLRLLLSAKAVFLHPQVPANRRNLLQIPVGENHVQQHLKLVRLFNYLKSSCFIFTFIFSVAIYDGSKRQLQIPKELAKIPQDLPLYEGEIPVHSLALMAYTVSTYTRPHKNQVYPNLNVQFVVVLHEPMEDELDAGAENEQFGEAPFFLSFANWNTYDSHYRPFYCFHCF